MTTGPARRAARAAAVVVSVVGTAAQAAAHWAATAAAPHVGHAGHAGHDGRMLLAHAAAAVLTVVLLARRGAALRGVVRLVSALLPALPGTCGPPPPADGVTAPVPERDRVLVGRVLATAQRRRGPPARTPLRPVAA